MDLRRGKKWKLPPQSWRPSLIAAYDESWTSTGRKWFQMKNSGEGQGKSRCPRMIKRRKWNWIGHTLRKGHEAIEREVLEWNPQGKRRRERPRHTWRRTVPNEALGKGKRWSEIKRMAENRTRWQCFVDSLCPLRDNRNWRWWIKSQAQWWISDIPNYMLAQHTYQLEHVYCACRSS